MPTLALNGGSPVRSRSFSAWPVWDDDEVTAIAEVVRSGHWGLPRGRQVGALEGEFARFHDASFGVAVPSGTAALELALRACEVGLGDEVITSPYTFIATVSSIFHAGAVPVFVEIDPLTFNLDPDGIESALSPYTKAIMPVHIAGCPADLDAVLAIAQRHNLHVIEDASQAHGARWRGQSTDGEPRGVGAIGQCGTFSFQSTKNLNCGEGGLLLTNDERLFERAFAHHYVGGRRDGSRSEPPLLGTNLRMTEFQAALLRSQMRRLPGQIALREANATFLADELRKLGVESQRRDSRVATHAWHLFIMRYQADLFAGASREQFLRALRAEGIPCSSGYTPLWRDEVWQHDEHVRRVLARHPRRVDLAGCNLPVCERVCREEAVWLTQNLLLGDRHDMNDIVAAVAKLRAHADEIKHS